MFDPTSRYYDLEDGTLIVRDADGKTRTVKYKRRRFIPTPDGMTVLVEHGFAQGERLDNIAARYFDDPLKFWVICDANEVMRPEELEEPGRCIKISSPGLGT